MAECYDCKLDYNDPRFQDLVISDDMWLKISPTGDPGGLLCPNCMCGRLVKLNVRCYGALMSGPIDTVTRETMRLIKAVIAAEQEQER